MPPVADILSMIPSISALHGQDRSKALALVKEQLLQFRHYLDRFIHSSRVSEVLQVPETQVESTSASLHSECCPPPPFQSYVLQFPAAGHLRLNFLALRIYVRTILYPPLQEAGLSIPEIEMEGETDAIYAHEICRTFAGLEAAFGENPDALLPCSSALIIAGFICPPQLRRWLWHKLIHFEQMGKSFLGPVKQNLSVVWGMPNLAAEGFGLWKDDQDPFEHQKSFLSVSDIDVVTKMALVRLNEE
jgi:hypothetical protein